MEWIIARTVFHSLRYLWDNEAKHAEKRLKIVFAIHALLLLSLFFLGIWEISALMKTRSWNQVLICVIVAFAVLFLSFVIIPYLQLSLLWGVLMGISLIRLFTETILPYVRLASLWYRFISAPVAGLNISDIAFGILIFILTVSAGRRYMAKLMTPRISAIVRSCVELFVGLTLLLIRGGDWKPISRHLIFVVFHWVLFQFGNYTYDIAIFGFNNVAGRLPTSIDGLNRDGLLQTIRQVADHGRGVTKMLTGIPSGNMVMIISTLQLLIGILSIVVFCSVVLFFELSFRNAAVFIPLLFIAVIAVTSEWLFIYPVMKNPTKGPSLRLRFFLGRIDEESKIFKVADLLDTISPHYLLKICAGTVKDTKNGVSALAAGISPVDSTAARIKNNEDSALARDNEILRERFNQLVGRDQYSVCIFGSQNAGKSSLVKALLGPRFHDKELVAAVSSIGGSSRCPEPHWLWLTNGDGLPAIDGTNQNDGLWLVDLPGKFSAEEEKDTKELEAFIESWEKDAKWAMFILRDYSPTNNICLFFADVWKRFEGRIFLLFNGCDEYLRDSCGISEDQIAIDRHNCIKKLAAKVGRDDEGTITNAILECTHHVNVPGLDPACDPAKLEALRARISGIDKLRDELRNNVLGQMKKIAEEKESEVTKAKHATWVIEAAVKGISSFGKNLPQVSGIFAKVGAKEAFKTSPKVALKSCATSAIPVGLASILVDGVEGFREWKALGQRTDLSEKNRTSAKWRVFRNTCIKTGTSIAVNAVAAPLTGGLYIPISIALTAAGSLAVDAGLDKFYPVEAHEKEE